MRQLTEFVHLYSGIPNSEAFVVLFERSPSHEPNQFYRFFVSTPRLLRNAANVKNLHADATQKVTNEKKPLIVIGSTDITGTFHLIGITVTSHETADAYALSFRAVKHGVSQITDSTIDPDVLICDADPAIHNGFQRIFGPKSIIMCYSHVKGNVERKYKFNNSKENKKPLQSDLYVLHKSYDKQTFDIGCQLFIQKWQNKEPTVVHNLSKSFFEKNANWYIGCIPRAPKTNNALERFNGTLKQLQTYYCRKPLKEFVFDALKICRQRSKHYRANKQPPQYELEVSEEELRKGCEHKKNWIPGREDAQGKMECYMFSSKTERNITEDDLSRFQQQVYDSFEDFESNAFSIWKITFPQEQVEWKNAVCTCPEFDKQYICKHIISIAHSLDLVGPPTPLIPNYDDEPLFKAKRGKPKKATPALVID